MVHGRRFALLASASVLLGGLAVALPAASSAQSTGAASAPVAAGTPSVPFLESVAAEGLAVQVSWAPNDPADAVTLYRVVATPKSGQVISACPTPGKVTVTAPASDSSVIVPGLCAQVVYTVTVSAHNRAGNSPASPASSPVVPLMAQVPSAPLIVSVVARDGSLAVSWTPPAISGGAALTGYTLTATAGSTVTTVQPGPSDTSATVSGLTDGTVYTLGLTALNSVGSSSPASSNGTPTAVYAPGVVSGFTTVPDGSGNVVASWQPPVDNGGSPVTGYTLTYQRSTYDGTTWTPVSGAPVHTLSLPASATTTTVSNFETAMAFYAFTITATNSAGPGAALAGQAPVTPVVAAKGKPAVLTAATLARLSAVTDTSLSWPDPAPAQITALVPGRVIDAAPAALLPQGTLRTVVSSGDTGGVFTLQTSDAALGDLFTNASLDSSIDANATTTPNSVKSRVSTTSGAQPRFVPSAAGVRVLPDDIGAGVGFGKSFTFGLDTKVGGSYISGEISLTAEANLDLNIHQGFAGIPDGLSVGASAKLTIAANVSVGLQHDLPDIPLGTVYGVPFDFQVGPVPVIVAPQYDVNLTASGKIGVTFESSATLGASLNWDSNSPTNLTFQNLSSGPKVTGGPIAGGDLTSEATIGVESDAIANLWDVAGPSVSVEQNLTADINWTPGPDDDFLTIGPETDIKVGLTIDKFGIHHEVDATVGSFTFGAFRIHAAPSATYTITPANPKVLAGKSLTLTATRSDGQTAPLTWTLLGNSTGDHITSSGVLTAGPYGGRTLTVDVSDATGASGQTIVTVGKPIGAPGPVTVTQTPGLPYSAHLAWLPPTDTGGAAIDHYVLVINNVAHTTDGPSYDTAQLSTGNYSASVYAVNAAEQVSPPASATFAIGEAGVLLTSFGPWGATTAPTPPDADPAYDGSANLESVDCPAVGFCVAIGFYDSTPPGGQEAVVLSGGRWTATRLPVLADNPHPAQLTAVSCASESWCYAVGDSYETSAGRVVLTADLYSEGQWSAQELPMPGDGPTAFLYGIDCPKAGVCTAVGDYQSAAFVLRLTGGKWKATVPPRPSNTNLDYGLTSVSCPATTNCIAVGSVNTYGRDVTLVETYANGAWTWSEPTPTDWPDGQTEATSVSCSSTSSCVSVGYSLPFQGGQEALIQTLSNGAWSTESATAPIGDTGGELTGVSCTTSGDCLAVGSARASGASDIYTQLPSAPSAAMSLPVPGNASSPPLPSVTAISCASSTAFCVAVGDYAAAPNGYPYGLIETTR